MEHILKRDSLGGGDIKLIAVMGLYLGMDETLYAMLGACILTLAVMLWPRAKSRKKRDVFPFGPALAVATGVMVLWDFCHTL
ncbi:MAG: A24 family peptidase, partial [Bariatricus sp.]|nr:A24 family peptidase [Bariatricus sp.]